MVKIHPFDYIVLNRISDKVTQVMMPITNEQVDEITKNISKDDKIIELNDFIINCDNITMYGDTNSDLYEVENIINRIIPEMLAAPGHINKKTLEVSLEMVAGCTTKRFYNYYCTLIGNPKNIIIFKHYGTFN